MSKPDTVFEVSFEVCNKIGGIHTVLATKARTLVEKFGDRYVCLGPLLLHDEVDVPDFEEEAGHERFVEACRQLGVVVRVGRWAIPGRPRTILIDFSRLYESKDDVLAKLWEDYEVDSISGDWDYVEPALFGHAAGLVIEQWWEESVAPRHGRAVAQFHEWMTGAGLLYLRKHLPAVGTVFTTHATMLGRALSTAGQSPDDGLGDETADELAERHGVVAKHSLEGACAREADVFTTVSEITAKEADLLHERSASPLLPNGIDLEVIDALAGDHRREEVAERLSSLASKFCGEDVGDAALLCVAGRYEFHNKGIDLILDALAKLEERAGNGGRRIVLFALVPAGNSGVRQEVLDRLAQPLDGLDGPIGLSTHNLYDEEGDAIHEHARRVGLENAPGSRVKVIQVPIYLTSNDDLLQLPYEAVVRAFDLTCFPSYYEPWGYTPQESLALGVPTVTSDYAGFGRWADERELDASAGVRVIERVHRRYGEVVEQLVEAIEAELARSDDVMARIDRCRSTASETAWSGFIAHYEEAFKSALESVGERMARGIAQRRRPKSPVPLAPSASAPRFVGFDVRATLPESLRGLERLARNFWWCWNPEAERLFHDLSPDGWDAARKSPIVFLGRVDPRAIEERAKDRAYVARLSEVMEHFEQAMRPEAQEADVWPNADRPVAYFSAEFAIHESLPIYSGGLGVLAGDHLKSASDLGVPLIAIGLFYRYGYMSQRLTTDGEQEALDVLNDPRNLAIERVRGADGEPLDVGLGLPGRRLKLAVWRVDVGRVPLYLLDADHPGNSSEDRELTRNLYGGETETRLLQEQILGRGGVRMLEALSIEPSVFHMNEGHAAFLGLERAGRLVRRESFTGPEARELVRASTAFTTHTPVPAGHDRFDEDLMRRYFSDASESTGMPWEWFFDLGRAPGQEERSFNMTYLGLRYAGFVNGVSKLHGSVSRKLLGAWWPGLVPAEVPVASITNGVHLASWTDPALSELMGVEGRGVRPADFARAGDLSAKALFEVKRAAKAKLLARVRRSLERSFLERSDSPRLLHAMLDGLDENALYVGFARRFAPYKRAQLLLEDVERLAALLTNEDRPLRFLVAGKAHPKDLAGQALVQQMVEIGRDPELAGRIVFLEDYDMSLARDLVSGVDVWLNTPTRTLEASGTSGMKAAACGALNLSIGDGWWPEAYDSTAGAQNGWMIAGERVYEDQELQDQHDAGVLYRLLEEEVVPLYFDRDADGVPVGWMDRVRASLTSIPGNFNTDRMVEEYFERAYRPLAARTQTLTDRSKVVSSAREIERLRRGFEQVEFQSVEVADLTGLRTGDAVEVAVELRLGPLRPDDVQVELIFSRDREDGELFPMSSVDLAHQEERDAGAHAFAGEYRLEHPGEYSYGVRVRPRRQAEGLVDTLAGLVVWA